MENDELSETRQVEESSNERSLKFYGVALPLNCKIACNGPLVFTKLCDVREILGKFKGARFCTFKNIDEAVQYALQPLEAVKVSTPKQKTIKKLHLSPRRLLPVIDLQKIDEKRVFHPFRDFFILHCLIKFGDVVAVKEFIWKHPNSLWNCGDIPSVTVGNIEFNALQTAVNHNYPLICQLFLDTFKDPKFLKLIFPGKPMAFISRMMFAVTKMYLTSGSQSTGDTPLHYASKFGFIDCCKVLLADPLCYTTVRNNDGLTPEKIICACADKQIIPLKEDIQALFTNIIDEKRVVPPFRDFFILHCLIKFGDVDEVNEFIWKHPNSLWNCGDIPSMTVGNIEFNALQAAVNHNYPLICQLILDTFEEPKFLKLIFPGQPLRFISRMMFVVIKKYLNSGSQSTGDTPLHYASKFGFIDCCKLLLADPLCNTAVRNNDGLTPEEIICACADEQIIPLKEDIQALFTNSMLYVPVFRSENNLSSFIGSPIKYKDLCKDLYLHHLNVEEYKNVSGFLLKAFAGPMSLEKAELFYEGLKNPSSVKHFKLTRLQKSMISKVNASDPEKGIERIGRRLADFLNVEWKEYFSAFNVFTDLCQKKGLRILEDCLRKRRKGFHYSGPLLSCNVPKKEILSFIQHYPPHLNPLNHQVNQLLVVYNKFLQVPVFDEDEEFRTPPSPFPESPVPLQSLGAVAYPQLSSSTLFLNGSSYSSSDIQVFLAVKDLDVPSESYPEICKWKISMASYLQNSLCENESLSNFELNLSRPLTVARPYEVDSTPRKRQRF